MGKKKAKTAAGVSKGSSNTVLAASALLAVGLAVGYTLFSPADESWRDPQFVMPAVPPAYVEQVMMEVDQNMRSGENTAGYMAMHAALERYPSSKELRQMFEKVVNHVLSQPVPGAGDLYKANLIDGGVKRHDASVLRQHFNLTTIDEFITAEEANGLIQLRHENEHTDQPALWCLSYANTDAGASALHELLSKHGLPADAMKVTAEDFTGTRGQCLRPGASAQLSKLLAGKSAFSSSLSFKIGSHPAIDAIAKRVEVELGLLDVHGASWMITKYSGAASYAAHTDCRIGAGAGMDRVATVLVYLTDTKGGGTRFTKAGEEVQPKAGRAVAWRNLHFNGECMPETEHEAMPLIEGSGEKIILQRWYHREASLDFRLPRESPNGVPEWVPGMNPIVCDESDKCRLYNEWTHY